MARRYISDVMPYETLAQWLTLDGSKMQDTELALLGEHGQYLNRHARLVSASALREQMVNLRAVRIDVGSQMRGHGHEHPIRRRLAFDLDAKDYQACLPVEGDAETKGADTRGVIRTSVWYALAMSARLLDIFLLERARADGYEKRYKSAIIFSGNRGAHLWLHNTYRDTLNDAEIIRLCDQEIPALATSEGASALYAKCPDDIREALQAYGQAALTSTALWERPNTPWLSTHLKPTLERLLPADLQGKVQGAEFYSSLTEERPDVSLFWGQAAVVLLCPRLDRGVTTGRNHLLKAPFSVHHKSGLISVPVDLRHADAPAWDLRNILVAPNDRDVTQRIREASTFFESTFL